MFYQLRITFKNFHALTSESIVYQSSELSTKSWLKTSQTSPENAKAGLTKSKNEH